MKINSVKTTALKAIRIATLFKACSTLVGILCAMTFAPYPVKATVLLTEDFNYTAGTLLTANGWTAHSGSGISPQTVVTPSPLLTYSGYSGGSGNAVSMTTSGEDDNKTFTGVTSGSVYCAFLVYVTASQTAGDYFLHFQTGTSAFGGRVSIKKDSASSSFAFGLARGSGTAATYTSFSYSLNTTYLVVVKYTFNTGTTTDDTASLFINPTLGGSEPSPTMANVTDSGPDMSTITAIGLRQGTAANMPTVKVDGIRVATTWSEAAASSVVTYTVAYNANGGTGSQTDPSSPYNSGATVTVLGAGSIARSGYIFAGWNTAAGGGGTSYSPGNTFAIAANTTLYAQWTPVYTVTYNGNGNTSGSAPTDSGTYANGATVTVLANTGALAKTGYTFAGWNTAADGSGTDYATTGSATFTMGSSNVTLYAKWTINTYSITYDGNGNDGGTPPVDANSPYNYSSTVTVLGAGTLTKSGNAFAGWNTASDGSGTSYAAGSTFNIAANTTLYAQWTASPTITLSGTLSAVNTTYGTASPTPTSFSVSGIFLTGDLTVTPPAGFEVSLSSGSGYTTSLNIPASGTLGATAAYVRLAATTGFGTYSGDVTVSGGGAATEAIATASSSVAKKELTITGLTGSNKVYDRTTDASFTGTATLSGVVSGDEANVTLSGSPTATFATFTAETGKAITVTGYSLSGTTAGNYNLTQPSLTADITPLALTVTGATVTSRPYDGTTTATITGATLVGIISPDVVTVSGGGTFADANAGTGIAVTAALALGGADAANYSLTQPTGLTGDITQATQTITFAVLPDKTTNDAPFMLTATASSGLPVTYSISAPAVATVSGDTVTLVGIGTTTITASQAGNANYTAAVDVARPLMVTAPILAGWDASGNTGANPLAASTVAANVTAGSLTKGSGITAGTAGNAWGGSGWNVASEALAISGNKFATLTVKANTGNRINFDAVSKLLYRTSSTGPSSGALQYSLDGSTFTDITNTITYALNTSSGSIGAVDLSSVGPLQGVPSSKTVTFRIVNWNASGSGGTWYVNNGNASGDDLVVTGTLVPNQSPSPTNITMGVIVGSSGSVQIIGGKYTPTDPEGDSLIVSSVTQGTNGSVSFTSSNVTYTSTSSAVVDSFTYTVSDGNGGTATGTVDVVLSSSPTSFNQLTVNGSVMTYLGIPGYSYALEHTATLSPAAWQAIITNQAASNGYLIFTNSQAGFFRTRYVSP